MPTATAKKHVSLYTVLVGGAAIAKEHADRITEIRVVSSLAAPDVCSLKIGFEKPKKGGKHAIDSSPFEVGKPIEVKLGETDSQKTTRLFKGDVVTVEPTFGSGGITVVVRAYDQGHKLFRTRRVRSFVNQTASDIVRKVCKECGLQVKVSPAPGVLKAMHQANETDWDFIQRLADHIGYEFAVVDGHLEFRKPKAGTPVELTWPDQLFNFRPRVTAVQQIDSVTVRSWDPKAKQPIKGTAQRAEVLPAIGFTRDNVRAKFKGDTVLVASEPVGTPEEAKHVAQSLLNKMSAHYATCDGLTYGNPKIKAGTLLNIKGVGTKYGGKYPVHTATHLLKGGGVYETHFTSSPEYRISALLGGGGNGSGASGESWANHVVIGVVSNNNDPDKMGRVKVKFPSLDDSQESWWARVVSTSAGKERGLMMTPQVNEEVLVAFEHGDMTRPYVLGSLYNGKDTPHAKEHLADKKGSFGLRSDVDITTYSKKLTKFVADETMDLQSKKAMTLKTNDNFNGHADKSMKLDATQQVNVEAGQAMTINCKGGSLKIECSSGMLELAATNIKLQASAMVQINGQQIMLG